MSIIEYFSGLAAILGSLVAVLGVCAGILRRRTRHYATVLGSPPDTGRAPQQ